MSVAGLAPAAETEATVIEDAPTDPAYVEARSAERQARRELFQRAVDLAAKGDATGAWKVLSADAGGEVTAELIGWRVVAVAGFLRNQSLDDAAAAFARFAYDQRWAELPQPLAATKRAEVAYWRACLAADFLGRRTDALALLTEARTWDASSERIATLQRTVDAAEKSFGARR